MSLIKTNITKKVTTTAGDAGEKQKAVDARTDWNMEIYKLTETVKKLLKKAEAEGAVGHNSFAEVFKDCLKVLRGY